MRQVKQNKLCTVLHEFPRIIFGRYAWRQKFIDAFPRRINETCHGRKYAESLPEQETGKERVNK
jgi:hypothetical protein